MKLIQPEENKIKFQAANEIIRTIFNMSSIEILNAFDEIGYTPKDFVTAEKSSLFERYAPQQAQYVIEQIFKDN